VEDFTKRFNKLYHKIPDTIQPTETSPMVAYSAAFEPDFAIALRERLSVALLVMQSDVVALEGNFIVAGKIKRIGPQWPEEKKKDKKEKDRKKMKEEPEASVSVKEPPKAKIEEKSKLIRTLSNKITRLEVEAQTPTCFPPFAPKNPNTFRRPFNPQILLREHRPEEQPSECTWQCARPRRVDLWR